MHIDRGGWRSRAVTCAVAIAAGAALAGCGSAPPAQAPQAPHAPQASPSPALTASSPQAVPYGACVARTYGRLTQAQLVGQLFLVGLSPDAATPAVTAALRAYHFGSLLLSPTAEGAAALGAATRHMQSLAAETTGGVRFFIAANQEGGEVQHLTGPGFAAMPSAVTQGTWSAAALRSAAAGWGRQLRAAGVNLDLAPVMDVVPAATAGSNAPVGALNREFGSTPGDSGAHGAAFIAGMAAAGVATTAKHFPGLGRVTGNTDFSSGVVDTVTGPGDPSLGSFRAAVSAGVPFVMVALARYTRIDAAELAVFSPAVMRLLRSGTAPGLGFGGVIMSDDLGVAAAVRSVPPGTRAISFLAAGGDMITSQSIPPAETMAKAIAARMASSPSFRAVVDEAVRRILAAKQAYGLLPC